MLREGWLTLALFVFVFRHGLTRLSYERHGKYIKSVLIRVIRA